MKKLLLTLLAIVACGLSVFANVKGDVNCDGYVTAADITELYNYLLNNDMTYYNTVDVNGDGNITAADVTFIYDILLGNYQPAEHEWVDLGLPSGTLWATMNVGADSPEGYGDNFAWGETTPKDVYNWSNYQWCMGSYDTFTKYCNMSSLGYNGFTDNKTELDPEDDAATANWGPEWCMPSMEQIQELCNNCTSVWTTRNGINGRLFTASNGASLFLPSADSWINYWSRTLYSPYPSIAYGLYFNSSNVDGMSDIYRDAGFPVRAVRVQEHEYVDLGLPSGTLWATMNVGANSPEEYGDYFAWGETTPKDWYDWSTYQWWNGGTDAYALTKYCNNSEFGYNGFTDNKTELDPEDDAATANWGPEWRMPSLAQIKELYMNCTWVWTTQNGINGRLFTASNGASLFLPATGDRWMGEFKNVGSWGYYWSRELFEYPNSAWSLYYITNETVGCNNVTRSYGFTVRAVRVP